VEKQRLLYNTASEAMEIALINGCHGGGVSCAPSEEYGSHITTTTPTIVKPMGLY
jgi:hypothetical protein